MLGDDSFSFNMGQQDIGIGSTVRVPSRQAHQPIDPEHNAGRSRQAATYPRMADILERPSASAGIVTFIS